MANQIDLPSSSSSSTPPPVPKWTYEVFLSFRGEDTRKGFTDHLYQALKQKGIVTFRDDEELERGKSINLELLKAIQESRYVIVILSENYANSSWCLEELAKAVECRQALGQKLLPVFYHVDPTDVRKQTGKFREAFLKHEEAFKDNIEKVQSWRDALFTVADLAGWHLKEYEYEVIQCIVDKIFTEQNQTISSISNDDFVGIDRHMVRMLSHLDLGSHDVRFVGVWGMGGVGKTTIAQLVSERIKVQFECYSFVANVREVIEKHGVVFLQEQLLSNLLKVKVDIQNVRMGNEILRHRLRTKMVLIILDDVDKIEQLEALCVHSSFGAGSRIIITTRDEHLLRRLRVDNIYEVSPLSDVEALRLFILKAFKKDQVREEFLELSKEFLTYAGGLPLAIEVLGSSLYGRNVKLWSSALAGLRNNPEKQIIDVLKVSFDGLKETEKKIFLDIACFFKGEDQDHVTRILEISCGHRPHFDIEVLIEKSLVTLFGRTLWMHDLIQELGREIVRRECEKDPGKRSRLWLPNDIFPLLESNTGTSMVEGINLNLPEPEELVHFINDPFIRMDSLRVLKIRNVKFSGNIKYLSNKLEFLDWHQFPSSCLPSNFQSQMLMQLNLHSSHIKQLWTGKKKWSRLTFINMRDSTYLTKTPDFTEVPDLETLVLEGCTRLDEVHPSIGALKNLTLLNMKSCKSVQKIPPFTSLDSLKTFTLSACSSLKKFPEIKRSMNSLLEVYLDGTAIEELPSSIEHLTGLTLLNLRDCKNLFCLPSTMQCLTSLKSLILAGCSEFDDMPENLNRLERLEELDISGTAIRESLFVVGMKNLKYLSFRGCKDLPSSDSWRFLFNCWWCRKKNTLTSLMLPTSVTSLASLKELDLSDCNLMDGAMPIDLGSLVSLQDLNLSANNFVRLPDSISELSKLRSLNVSNCRNLKLLPKLPLSVRHVHAEDCTSLLDFPNQFKVWTSAVSGTTTVNSLISSNINQEVGDVSRTYTSSGMEMATQTELPNRFEVLTSAVSVSGTMTIKSLIPSKNIEESEVPSIEDVSRTFTSVGNGMTTFSISSEDRECKPLVDEFSLPIQVLQKDLELLDYRCSLIHSDCHQNGIPEWFKHSFTGYYAAVTIPSCLKDDNKWMGVAAVCLLQVQAHPAVSIIESESSNYLCKCTIRTHEFAFAPVPHAWREHRSFSSHVLCFFYLPWVCFPKRLNQSSMVQVSFETNDPCLEVQSCGIHLLYELDVAGFINTCLQCFGGGLQRALPSQIDEATFESGWFNLVDDILSWEEQIPACEEGSIDLLRRRNIQSILPRYLEGLKHKVQMYPFFLSGTPAWFNPESGHYLSRDVPLNLDWSKKWMGFALCVSLAVDEQIEDVIKVSCLLQMGTSKIDFSSYVSPDSKHQLLIFYIPRALINVNWFFDCSRQICTSFETDSPGGVKIQTCGFRILYQQDLLGFVQVITNCMLCRPFSPAILYPDHNEILVDDWLNLLRLEKTFEVETDETDCPASLEVETDETDCPASQEIVWTQPSAAGCVTDCSTSTSTPQETDEYRISRDYRNRDWSMEQFGRTIPGVQTPKWFKQLNRGYSAQIHLPPNSFNDENWIGIAVCCTISIIEHPNIIVDTPDLEFSRVLLCTIETDITGGTALRLESRTKKLMWLHACKIIWFIYMARPRFPESWNQCNRIDAIFQSNNPGLGLHECTGRLVYKDDVEQLVQELTLCELNAICPHCKQAVQDGTKHNPAHLL